MTEAYKFEIPQESAFRRFCREKWYEHKDEILAWTGSAVDYDADYYFRKHRWLLRRLYINQTVNLSKNQPRGGNP